MSDQKKLTGPVYYEMGHALPTFNRNFFMTEDLIPEFRKQHQNKGLYRSAYGYYDIANLKTSPLIADFYMDFDSKEDVELAREDIKLVIWQMHQDLTYGLPIEAFRIYFSGMKGFHLIIPREYLGIKAHPQLDNLFKWIALGFFEQSFNETVDLVVYERRRLFRLENSQHQKTGLYKIPLQYHELLSFSLEEIHELAKQPRQLINYPKPELINKANKMYLKEAKAYVDYEKEQAERFKNYKNVTTFKRGEIPEYIERILQEGPVEGTRNETAAGLASFFMQQGLTQEETWQELVNWNQGSLKESSLRATMYSIYRGKHTYGKRRLQALADHDLTKYHFEYRTKEKGDVPWKNTNTPPTEE